MLVPKVWRKGKPISAPGIYADVPMDVYHSAGVCIEPSISSSGLRTIFSDSPRHYWAFSYYNPKKVETPESEAMILGRAAHHRLFGQDDFDNLFIVRPDRLGGEPWHGSKAHCRMWLAQAKADNLTVVTSAQMKKIDDMADALRDEPLVIAGALNGEIERSWFVKDDETGVWLKIRPDASPNDSLDFVDLKVTTSVDPESLQYAIRDYGYWQQGGLCAEVCQKLIGKPMNSFTLFFIESKYPHCIAPVTLSEQMIELGIKANRVALRKFDHGMRTGEWLGPGGGGADAKYIHMRDFDTKKIESRIKEWSE